jgi:hypothetical protein
MAAVNPEREEKINKTLASPNVFFHDNRLIIYPLDVHSCATVHYCNDPREFIRQRIIESERQRQVAQEESD